MHASSGEGIASAAGLGNLTDVNGERAPRPRAWSKRKKAEKRKQEEPEEEDRNPEYVGAASSGVKSRSCGDATPQ
jgi:hypothetical protein